MQYERVLHQKGTHTRKCHCLHLTIYMTVFVYSAWEATTQGTFKMCSLHSTCTGGLLIQGRLTGNNITLSWLQWSSRTGGRLDRFHWSLVGWYRATVLTIKLSQSLFASAPCISTYMY